MVDIGNAESTSRIVCDGPTASEILAEATQSPAGADQILWAGTVTTDWTLSDVSRLGDLFLLGEIAGDLDLRTEVAGNLVVKGFVGGNLLVQDPARVVGSLVVVAEVQGDLDIWSNVKIDRDVEVRGYIGGDVGLSDNIAIGGTLTVFESASVGNHLVVSGSVAGDLVVRPIIDFVDITARVGGQVVLPRRVDGNPDSAHVPIGANLNLGFV